MKSFIDIDVLESYNTVKATLPYLVESAGKHRTDGKTQPPNGTGCRIVFVSTTLHYNRHTTTISRLSRQGWCRRHGYVCCH
jgi:peroxisomal 2,4-dienoyl-CoA reductase